jgi:hypothetical protein
MKFFNIDCHISVIEDVKTIFTNLGHTVDSVLLSGHAWVMNRASQTTKVVTAENWRNIDDPMCEAFYEAYKHDLADYDGFIVTYPPVFAKLFEKFDKPILMYVPIRYEVPFSGKPEEWKKFNSFLQRTIDSGQVIPIANSLYDKAYCEYFLDREFTYIANICDYTKTQYQDLTTEYKNPSFLYESKLNLQLPPNIFNKSLLGKYTWKQIAQFKGIINIPYTSSTMSIFEHYTANIPMFVPSRKFLMELYENKQFHGVMSEVTWNQVEGLKPGSSILNTSRNDDPNAFLNDEMRLWFAKSDFYQKNMEAIIKFDSLPDLQAKLIETDCDKVAEQMKQHNIIRKEIVYYSWQNILKRIQK